MMTTTPEELAATLARRHRRALEHSRARASEVRSRVTDVIRRAGQHGRIRRAFLIGSLPSGTFGAGSDVDLVVEGLAPDDVGPLYDELVSAARLEVDLLRIEELSPTFRARVEAEGTVIYGA